jgi:D-xylose transport system substrate-binding protein
MSIRKLAALTAVAAMVLAACTSTPGASAGGSAAGSQKACLIGVSWNDYDQERWKKADEPAIKKAIAAAGGTYTRTDAKKSSEQQLTDIDNLLGQGVGAIILLSKDTQVIQPALDRAAQAGVPVIAYDRLIEGDNIFYITFDNKKVGTIMGQEILKAAPEGNYAIILGDATDANAAFLRSGMTEAGVPAKGDTSGKVHVVFEQNTPDWSTEGARNNMEAALNSTTPVNDIQAVLSENDGMATGAVEALKAVGLTIPISGQDGDKAALNRVALGTQTVSVWKNAFALGDTAGSAAMQLCNGTALSDITAPTDLPAAAQGDAKAVQFTTPGGKKVWSITLTPQPLKKDNVHDAIDAGWVTQAEVCTGVPAGTVTGCP